MEARHREQIHKHCQEKGLHHGQRPAHWRAQYEHEIWCTGASMCVGCEYLCVMTRESQVLHGERPKHLVPPRKTKDRKHLL